MYSTHKGRWEIYRNGDLVSVQSCFYDSVDYCAELGEPFLVNYKEKKIYMVGDSGEFNNRDISEEL